MDTFQSRQRSRVPLLLVFSAFAMGALLLAPSVASAASAAGSSTCQLKSPKGNIQHVIYIQFDNTHFRRDNPNVPSDLEQMPHLFELHHQQWHSAQQ
jgi:hypothetical protein